MLTGFFRLDYSILNRLTAVPLKGLKMQHLSEDKQCRLMKGPNNASIFAFLNEGLKPASKQRFEESIGNDEGGCVNALETLPGPLSTSMPKNASRDITLFRALLFSYLTMISKSQTDDFDCVLFAPPNVMFGKRPEKGGG